MKDLFGKAMLDYYLDRYPANIITETSISEADEMEIAYMFRDFKEMPTLEQQALNRSFGKVLDIGCGAGSHALHLQNKKKLEVTAIDYSESAIRTCRLRGVINAEVTDVFNYNPKTTFDTILLLMNGTGICAKISKLPVFLKKIKSFLSKNGQILIDSTDIRYMYDINDAGQIILPADMNYFGELQFFLTYKGQKEIPFDWLYLDFKTLEQHCVSNGLHCSNIYNGKNHEYLAKITVDEIG